MFGSKQKKYIFLLAMMFRFFWKSRYLIRPGLYPNSPRISSEIPNSNTMVCCIVWSVMRQSSFSTLRQSSVRGNLDVWTVAEPGICLNMGGIKTCKGRFAGTVVACRERFETCQSIIFVLGSVFLVLGLVFLIQY